MVHVCCSAPAGAVHSDDAERRRQLDCALKRAHKALGSLRDSLNVSATLLEHYNATQEQVRLLCIDNDEYQTLLVSEAVLLDHQEIYAPLRHFQVERIECHRMTKKGPAFKVKWMCRPDNHSSWMTGTDGGFWRSHMVKVYVAKAVATGCASAAAIAESVTSSHTHGDLPPAASNQMRSHVHYVIMLCDMWCMQMAGPAKATASPSAEHSKGPTSPCVVRRRFGRRPSGRGGVFTNNTRTKPKHLFTNIRKRMLRRRWTGGPDQAGANFRVTMSFSHSVHQ